MRIDTTLTIYITFWGKFLHVLDIQARDFANQAYFSQHTFDPGLNINPLNNNIQEKIKTSKLLSRSVFFRRRLSSVSSVLRIFNVVIK